MMMFHDQGAFTVPRNFKIGREDDEMDGPRSPSAYDEREVNDLKFSLDRALINRDRTSGNELHRSSRRSRHDPRRNTTGVTEYDLRQKSISSPNVHTVKDQEWLIQDLKKENFDLKLRLFMEQKEREKLLNGNNRQTSDLEVDLTEALDELEHAMDKENQLTHEMSTVRRREKTLSTKLKRLERVCQHQEEDIISMSVELENLKMEIAAKDSGIVSPSGPRSRLHGRQTLTNNGGRTSPTSDFTDRCSDRLSAGYPERFWDRYSDRNSDRGSDSGSYVTTPHERKTFFGERHPDDMSTSDESEMRSRVAQTSTSDVERLKRREKLLSRRVKNYQEVEGKGTGQDSEDNTGSLRDRVGDANESPHLDPAREHNTPNSERAVNVAPDLLSTTSARLTPHSTGKSKGFLRTRLFAKKSKGNKAKSKSMDELNDIGRVDVKNIHKKNKKYNFWGCVRARESVNENIRSEYAPVKRPQLTVGNIAAENDVRTNGNGTAIEFI